MNINRFIFRNRGYCKRTKKIICNDGFDMSVQASKWHYCMPANDVGPYTHVEIGYPSIYINELSEYKLFKEEPIYYRVPIKKVKQIIKLHGGINESCI